jgi:DtxR family transcriptional regulator, Mn-dependent transcriptional regulator
LSDLIDTTEMYLRTILELEEEGQVPLRARISERLEQSGPTVSQTVGRMERDGLVVVSDDRHLELTAAGRALAVQVMRKHRLVERLLADIIGLEWEFVHDEACRWEHVVSEQVERKIIGLLSTPDVSPYGNPIPGLEQFGLKVNPAFNEGVISIANLPASNSKVQPYVLRRIGEPLQVDPEVLAELKSLGLVPGAQITVEFRGALIFVSEISNAEGIELDADLAHHLFVEK